MSSPYHNHSAAKRLVVMVFVTLAYVVAGKIGLGFASIHLSASPVWAPAGMAVAFLLLFGFSLWPTILIGAFLVNVTTSGSVLTSGSIALGNTLEGLLGALLVQRFAHGVRTFESPPDVFKFAVFAGLLSPVVSATIGVTSLTLGSYASLEQYTSIWLTWWLGDAAGILIVTPALILWARHPRVEWKTGQLIELVLLVVVLFATCAMIFGAFFGTQKNYPMEFFLVPVLIWAAFRFNPRETATLSILLAGWAVWGTMHGRGPFTSESENDALILSQAFLGVNSVMSLALAAGVQERIKTETVLHETNEQVRRFAAIVESSNDAIISKTLDGTVVTWNKGAERLFGYTDHEVIGRGGALLLPPGLDDEQQILSRITSGEGIENYETQRLRKGGTVLNVSVTVSPIKNREGFVIGASSIMRDVTTRKQAEHALQESQARLQDLACHLEDMVKERTEELRQSKEQLRAMANELNLAEQRERKRVAGELHDYLAQLLVLCRLNLGQLRRTGLSPKGEETVRDTEEVLSQALNYCRTLIGELSPPVLQEHGLEAGLKWLGEQMQHRGLKVSVEIGNSASLSLSEDSAMLLFQSVRELLMNVIKHAGTPKVTVRLREEAGTLRIQVRDEGVGFGLAAVGNAMTTMSSKFGLFSIRERMIALGGWFDLQSAVGQGTCATLVLPLARSVETNVPLGKSETTVLSTELSRAGVNSHLENSARSPQHSACREDTRIRVLLVDDHAMVRQGLRSVLEAYTEVEIVGEAWNGEEALALVERLQPSIVVMDINMPKMNGIEATAQIRSRYPSVMVIGLSVQAGGVNEEAMRNAGAAMLLTKEAAVEELYRSIRETRGNS